VSFDPIAPHYRWLELVLAGEKLQRCRTTFLEELREARNILILGEGNGRFLAELIRRVQPARVTCVDSSARMLALARSRISRTAKLSSRATTIDFVHADALAWQPTAEAFDAIVTHFFLDCFRPDQLAGLIDGLGEASTSRACWLLADFQVPARGMARWRARAIHQLMYVFFRVITRLPARALTPPDLFLERNRFGLCERRVSDFGLLHTDLWRRC
jgi:SAM-dependent methyltransferase